MSDLSRGGISVHYSEDGHFSDEGDWSRDEKEVLQAGKLLNSLHVDGYHRENGVARVIVRMNRATLAAALNLLDYRNGEELNLSVVVHDEPDPCEWDSKSEGMIFVNRSRG